MKVIDLNKLPIYEADPPYTRRNKVIVDRTDGCAGASMGIGIYRKGERALMHTHEHEEEIIYFTAGRARVTLADGQVFEFGPETVIYVPAGEAHLLENAGEEELRFIFVYTPQGPEAGIKKWKVVG